MPRVPSYQAQQVDQASVPGLRTSGRVQAQPIGADALSITSQSMSQEFRQQRQRINDTMLTEAETKLIRLQNDLESNSQTGYQNVKGKDSVSIPTTYGESWDKGLSSIADGITDKGVAEQFRLRAERNRASFDLGIQRHISNEIGDYESQEFKANLDANQTAALEHYQDPAAVVDANRRQEDLISRRVESGVLSPEAGERLLAQARSASIAGVINRHLDDNNDITAKEWRSRYGDRLLPDDQDRIDKVLEVQSTDSEAMRIADRLTDKPLDEALAETGKIQDVRLRDKAESRLMRQRLLFEQAKNEEAQGISDNILRTLETEPGKWDAVKPSEKARLLELNPKAYNALETMANKTVPVVTDTATYYQLQIAAAKNPELFVRVNLLEYADRLGNTERNTLINLQADIIKDGNKPGGTSSKLTQGILSREDAVSAALRGAGLDASTNINNDDLPMVDRFRQVLDQQITSIQGATNKPMTTQEVGELAKKMLAKEVISSGYDKTFFSHPITGWFGGRSGDSERYAFENPAVIESAYSVDQIPTARRDDVVDELREQGRPITEENIMARYNERLQALQASEQ